MLAAPAGGASEASVSGALLEPSCVGSDLAATYSRLLPCAPGGECSSSFDALAPGLWVHRIVVTGGEALGQAQARRALVLDATAGTHGVEWKLFRSVHTVSNLSDDVECEGCLRAALAAAQAATKPALVAFDTTLAGDVVLADALPELAEDDVTIDGLDFDGVAHRRGIDANGLNRSALLMTGARNHVIGLRITNVGGDADMLLLEGPQANDNRIESVQIVGRATEICERLGQRGCVVDRECVIAGRLTPRGNCGDDGIAVRNDAGRDIANHVVGVDVAGAFDKGIKISEGGVATISDAWVHDNTDGGIQATIGGQVTVVHTRSENNRASLGANGLAANGPRLETNEPARIQTRGNLIRNNALRGVSVRSLSQATLRDDYLCGNGTAGTDAGFGLALLDAAGASAEADAKGIAVVRNVDGGVLIMGSSLGTFGNLEGNGLNAFAFNGIVASLNGPPNFRNFSSREIAARGNHWEQCGPTWACDVAAVATNDLHTPGNTVRTNPLLATPQRRAPVIAAIEPTFARNGDLVRIYGENFDAIGQAQQHEGCDGPGRPCTATDANCLYLDRQPVEVVAATPTMLVIRMPFTCVEPLRLAVHTRRAHGVARATFCTVE